MNKRLDVLLTEGGYAPSREKAKAMVQSGIVYVNGLRQNKASMNWDDETAVIEVRGQGLRYVSRGGLKLEKALQVFPIDLQNRVCMDIGASTGGFTDCMLQNGASYVYAIDVGSGQLHARLRQDTEHVRCMEQTNFRYLRPEDLDGPRPTFASCDVSFISLSRILPAAYEILPQGGEMVALVKPQFEAGRSKVGKKGVVKDPAVHAEVLETVTGYAMTQGFDIAGLDYSPIRGPEGNIEYLLYLRKPATTNELPQNETAFRLPQLQEQIRRIVKTSHSASTAGEQARMRDVRIQSYQE